jgi:transcriptional regulator with XRE-family HTH domain
MQANERQREAVMMRLDGYTYEEIGNRLGVTKQWAEQIVKSAISERRARRSVMKCIYPAIRDWMRENGYNYSDVSELIDVCETTVSRIMRGSDVRFSTMKKLAQVAGMTLTEAFEHGD